jgi:SAM-dependent methyltransferase
MTTANSGTKIEDPKASDHIPYTIVDQEPRQYEYNLRFKVQALELMRGLPLPPDKISVLDFGCGRGEFLQMLKGAGFACVGVDFDSVCVKLSSQYAPCYQAAVENVRQTLKGQLFDVVTCLHVLEHIENPRQAVEELKHLTRRWLILAVPNLAIPIRLARGEIKPCDNLGHFHGWDAGHFQNFLENKCGLRIVRWIPDVVILPKVSRFAGRLGVRSWLEYRWLPKHFPFLSTSLITLCELNP